MKKAKAGTLTILLLTTFLLSGCGLTPKTSQDEVNAPQNAINKAASEYVDTHSDDGRIVVGISMPDRLLERWNKDGSYLRAQFEKSGCEVLLRFANNLIDTQENDIRDMINEGADLLVVTAVDCSALSDVLTEAHAANVKIIAYDRLIMESDAVDYYVSFDNYKVGQLQAEYIINTLHLPTAQSERHIEFVTGDPVDNNSRYFYNGAMNTLLPYLSSGILVPLSGQSGFYETSTAQWSTDLAQQRLQIILNSYYPEGTDLDAVLCANDSTALGAVRALSSDYAQKNKVLVTGQDADIANIYSIIEGTQSMTVFKALRQESVVTVSLGLSLLEGNTPASDLITSSDWDFSCSYNTTDYDNGSKTVPSYLLEPISITQSNLEAELFDTGYYRRNSAGLIYAAK